MKKTLLFLIVTILCFAGFSQNTVSGIIKDSEGSPLPGVTILVKGTNTGNITDMDGKFTVGATSNSVLVISYVGFKTKEIPIEGQSALDITLFEDASQLSEIVVLGSRSQGRTKIETPAPVDVINISEQSINMPQLDLSQMLVASAPSFSAFSSQGGDLSSHVTPPTLRGLAPNQMLVLVNGKRRHTSALLAATQTGSSANSVDMSLIAPASIERVEILRDGAAAQYGSDAIAGVMNIVLKKGTGEFSGDVTVGYNPNIAPDIDDPTISDNQKTLIEDTTPDGQTIQFSGNYGVGLNDGGYLNIGGLFRQQERTTRVNVQSDGTAMYGDAYLNNQRTDTYGNPIITNPELLGALAAGDDALAATLRTDDGLLAARGLTREDLSTFAGQPRSSLATVNFNLEVPVSPYSNFYSFGDFGYKYTEGFSCFYRRPAQADRANFDLFPNGFRPQILSNQTNISLTGGIEGKAGDLNYDFSSTIGSNSMKYDMFNTFNASLQSESPTEMNLGTHKFTQSTTNFDLSRFFPDVLGGLNIGAGLEMRLENYKILRGQEESYEAGDAGLYTASSDNELLIGPDGLPLEGLGSAPEVDGNGNPISLEYAGVSKTFLKGYSPNCQCFRGFAPSNEADQFRFVSAAYLDMELDITRKLLLTAAVRRENYSDFGGVLTGKVASRFKLTDNWALRGSLSSGFRAPSLQELNYSHTYTFFVGLNPFDGSLYSNDSQVAKAIGIGQLEEETSRNISVGIAGKLFEKLEVTIDAYKIDISDRLFQTDEFTAADAPVLLPLIGSSGRAAFRINGGDISTKGIEVVLNYSTELGSGKLGLMYSGSFRENTFEEAKVPELNTALSDEELEAKYVDRGVIGQLEQGVSNTNMIGSVTYSVGKFSSMIRAQYFGAFTDVASNALDTGEFPDQDFSAQTTFDLGVTYMINEKLSVTAGGNNIFNAYPDLLSSNNRGFYLFSNYQQGSNGSYYFARLSFSL